MKRAISAVCILISAALALSPVVCRARAQESLPAEINEDTVLAVNVAESIRIIYEFVTEHMGLNTAVACGILSNIKAESSFNPGAIGDNGNSYGICQWGSRKQAMMNFCYELGYDTWITLEGQLGYMEYELGDNKKNVGDYLKNVPNTPQGAYDAAYYFCYYYEIPANRASSSNKRGINAVNTYWPMFGGTMQLYDVVFDANGGVNAPSAQVKTEGVPLTLTESEPRRQGFSLAGWSEDAGASAPTYTPGSVYSENRAIRLYAVWQQALEDDTTPARALALGNHLYEYYEGDFTWSYASEFARSRGGTLASVRSADEAALIARLTSGCEGACYLGGMLSDGNWVWSTGEAFDDSFANGYWASGEPALRYGESIYNRLALTPSGEWVALTGTTNETKGFVIEYGENDSQDFITYRVIVSSTLNLRAGPGTSYASLGKMQPGTLITIYESVKVSSGTWGWGVTNGGARGWCSMSPSYLVKVNDEDETTHLTYEIEAGGNVIIKGYAGAASSLIIPRYIADCPVTGIDAGAFTAETSLKHIVVGDFVTFIATGAFHPELRIECVAGSTAHRAAALEGLSFALTLPGGRWILPEATRNIGAEAFAGCPARCVDMSKTRVDTIATGAFGGCSNLTMVILPATVRYIAPDAFPDDDSITFIVTPGGYAEGWALDAGYDVLPCAG